MPRPLHVLALRGRRVALLRVTLITLMLLAVAAVAVACGGDDDGDDADQQLVARIAQLEADLGEAQASAAEAQDTADAAAAAAEGDASSAQADAAELEDRIADLEADLRDARAAVEAAAGEESATITIYSGRSESLVGPIIEQFEADSGINVRVRYGGTSELAAALLEEGDRSPADVFFAQDAGALGAIEAAGLFAALPGSVLDAVAPGFRSTSNAWTGVSGRARVLVYSTERVATGDLPDSVFDLTGPEWTDRVSWAPANGSFQAFVTAMRQIEGEERTAQWLRDMLANGVSEYRNNSTQVQAVGDGEIDIGLVNHYYLFRFTKEDAGYPAANHYTDAGRAGALINIAGLGILAGAENQAAALTFVEYLLSDTAQNYFRDQTFEYPLNGLGPAEGVPSLAELSPPSLALTDLSDLEGTLELLREVGALP